MASAPAHPAVQWTGLLAPLIGSCVKRGSKEPRLTSSGLLAFQRRRPCQEVLFRVIGGELAAEKIEVVDLPGVSSGISTLLPFGYGARTENAPAL